MRFLALGIVVAFPVIDLYLTMRFAQSTGSPLWVWLSMGTIGGLLVLRSERLSFRSKTLASMHGQYSLLRSLLDSGRKVLAGILLLLPGVVSDLAALALLALPINLGRRLHPQAVGAGGPTQRRRDPLEGDFRRLD